MRRVGGGRRVLEPVAQGSNEESPAERQGTALRREGNWCLVYFLLSVVANQSRVLDSQRAGISGLTDAAKSA